MSDEGSSLSAFRDRLTKILTALGVAVLVFDAYALGASRVAAVDIPTSAVIRVCGDGIVSSSEACDDGAGNNIGTYGSSTAGRVCNSDCESFGPYCGDAVLQVRFGEQCDDGNNTSGDLCDSSCLSETAVPPTTSGSPTVGPIPTIPGAVPGTIPALTPTKVVIRGKAYPNALVTILLDGKSIGSTQADANADFLYTTIDITPGVASFGFLSHDTRGTESLTTSAIFEVVQSAITTVSNVFLPPTISVSSTQVKPGDLLTIQGQSVPKAKVKTDIYAGVHSTLIADTDTAGLWSLQVDTKSLKKGANTAKSLVEFSDAIKSGYGRSVSFYIGDGALSDVPTPDLTGDRKVNLVDFSIFLLSWGTADARADFNKDGKVNLADFSIMLFNWTG